MEKKEVFEIYKKEVSRIGGYEDELIDRLIRRHGYRGTESTLQAVEEDPEVGENLSAAAHLIHGSSEGRFEVVYCPGHLTKEEVEKAGFQYGNLEKKLNYLKHLNLRMEVVLVTFINYAQ